MYLCPLLNISRNKNLSSRFSAQQKITTFISEEGEETAAEHKDIRGNIQFTEPDTQPLILTSAISLSMSSFHADTVNRSLTLSKLLCSPVLWSLLENTFCQFTQQLSQPMDDHNILMSALNIYPLPVGFSKQDFET